MLLLAVRVVLVVVRINIAYAVSCRESTTREGEGLRLAGCLSLQNVAGCRRGVGSRTVPLLGVAIWRSGRKVGRGSCLERLKAVGARELRLLVACFSIGLVLCHEFEECSIDTVNTKCFEKGKEYVCRKRPTVTYLNIAMVNTDTASYRCLLLACHLTTEAVCVNRKPGGSCGTSADGQIYYLILRIVRQQWWEVALSHSRRGWRWWRRVRSLARAGERSWRGTLNFNITWGS